MNVSPTADPVDVFVSYAGPDRPWAEWVAHQLLTAGYSVELDVWNWSVGSNAVLNMDGALNRARRVVALYSAAYFERNRFSLDEWTAVLAERPDAHGRRRLVPVRVEAVNPPTILAPLVYGDLFGLDEQHALEVLLKAVEGVAGKPSTSPHFPGRRAFSGGDGPRRPGTYPAVWNVPHRHPAFTGREAALASLRERLTSGDRAVVQALHGWGGVGKTQVAIEYAHLFGGAYELVWWIDAERPDLIGEQISALAVAAGWVDPETIVTTALTTTMQRLRAVSRWLMIFDNAESAEHLASWLPPQNGHVIITSRSSTFADVAIPVELDVFTRSESITLLRQYLPLLGDREADRLAHALGDLPLGLAQAGGLIVETKMTVPEYLAELDVRAAMVLAESKPASYTAPLAAAVQLSTSQLRTEDPAAFQLLNLCAYLAPEPIPLDWFTAAGADALDEPLATVVTARLAFRLSLRRLARVGLARLTDDGMQLHRLTQAVLRDQGTPQECEMARQRVEGLIASVEPDNDGSDPASWPAWATLLPHLLTLDPATAGRRVWTVACNALYYLVMRGEYQTALSLAEAWHRHWLAAAGPDDRHVLWAANQVATAHHRLGHHEQARRLNEDTLSRHSRALGDDHSNTLTSANNLAVNLAALGDHERARQLNEDTLNRRRRALGDDHPDTLRSANNLAINLAASGDHERARQLNEDTLNRRRRVLGDDHPDTLSAANNLAVNLTALGEDEQARQLDEDTLNRRRRVLGDDHPDTLSAANNLAYDLTVLGHHEQARQLNEDTLNRRRRVLGTNHPDTLKSAAGLAINLAALGDDERSRQLTDQISTQRRRVPEGDALESP
ncbi:FxSxx-COOH system tetratricopeptide repeat protein [Micromonospora coriariae]|uniref:FxSxx-COOH system tetratricopeptide repeat protein n=1 Tax=Micromonospora coriariae TaxID=285665 RepID=UPI00156074D0|nr:FxSxx-COOH system tetratricopeptide repeat protein [Micromonospora coriariae]